MWESIKELIGHGDYTQAREELDKIKAVHELRDDIFAILDASVYEALGDKESMYDAISGGLSYNPKNYELYYMLGFYYYDRNPNQAFLCFQNAAFYCDSKDDLKMIQTEMNYLKESHNISVRNTDIIIVSYNTCYFLQKNLESIRNTLLKGTYRIIVVDNASEDGAAEWLEEQNDVILIRNRENKGFACACNQGANLGSGKEDGENDVFLLNNDTRLAINSLFWLRMGLYENDEIGAVGSCSNYAGNEQQLDINFSLPNEYLQYGAGVNVPLRHPYEERVRLCGFAMMIKRKVWNFTEGMDEQFTPGFLEDDDISMQIQQKGFRLLLCKNSFIYHAGSQSFGQREDIEQLFLEHYQLFIKKYGFDILEYVIPNKKLLEGLSYSEKDELNVLQIGSGLGADLKWMRTLYPKANVVGVETDEALYRIAVGTEAVFLNVEEVAEVFERSLFDVLIVDQRIFRVFTEREKRILAGLCKRECVLLAGRDS